MGSSPHNNKIHLSLGRRNFGHQRLRVGLGDGVGVEGGGPLGDREGTPGDGTAGDGTTLGGGAGGACPASGAPT
jgi:hypothetical protein